MIRYFYFVILLITSNSICSQNEITVSYENHFNTDFKDFVLHNQNVYALTNGDSLISWNLKSNSVKLLKTDIKSIVKSDSILYTLNNQNKISLFDFDVKWTEIFSFSKLNTEEVLIDQYGNTIVLNDKGVFYKGENYSPTELSSIYRPNSNKSLDKLFFQYPDYSFVDSNDIVWLTYDYGEFGNELWFFDLSKKKFFENEWLRVDVDYNWLKESNKYFKDLADSYPNKIKIVSNDTLYRFPANVPVYYGVKGMVENDNGEIFISQSLMHLGILHGCIMTYKENNKYDQFFSSNEMSKTFLKTKQSSGKSIKIKFLEEYIGPIAYNAFDEKLYYFSNEGFFKIIKKRNGYEKDLVLKTELHWEHGLKYSLGQQMAVKKFEFLNQQDFIFLTDLNGLGYFNGVGVNFLK